MNSANRRQRVAVVGGGLAGLAAAISCADAGAEVILLEARPRLGGATWSFEQHGMWFDNGQHVFLRCCTAYRSFLERLGMTDQVRLQDRLDIPVVGADGRMARLRRSRRLPAPLHLARCLAAYPHVPLRQRPGLLPAALALRAVDPADPRSDDRTFLDWLQEHGQGPAAVDALWDLITLPTVNLPAREASLAMAAMVFRTGLLERADAADIGWSRVPLGRLHGDAGRRALEQAGGRVLLRTGAVALLPASDGIRVALGGDPAVGRSPGTLDVDGVILAVPHDQLGALLPPGSPPFPERLAALGRSPIVNVHVVYDRRVTDHELLASVGGPVQWVFDHTEAGGLEQGQALTVSLSAADDRLGRPAGALTAEVVAELARLLPRAAGARVVHSVVTRERAATFRAVPGTATLRPGPMTADRRVWVAGAWTDTGWPATMEGAVRSGRSAARRLLLGAGEMSRLPEEVSA